MSFWWRSTRGLTCRYVDKTKKKRNFFISLPTERSLLAWKKQPTFHDTTTSFPAKGRLRNERRNSILMTRYHPDLGSASDWLKICFNQSATLPRSWKCYVTSTGCLCSFLRRHFAGKPVAVSRKDGCFFQACSLRVIWHFPFVSHHPFFSLLLTFCHIFE